MSWNKDGAISYAKTHVQPQSTGNYDGQQWISDFVQRSMYPGPGYRELHPHYELFRHD